MKKNWIKLIIAAALLGHGAAGVAGESDVPVANYTRIADFGVRIKDVLPEEIQAELKKRKLVIYADASSFERIRLCQAVVGITEKAAPGLNVRYPSYRKFSAKVMDEASWDASKCELQALSQAMALMSQDQTDVVFADTDLVRNEGGRRLSAKADPKSVNIHQIGGMGDQLDPLFEMLHEKKTGALFDYRAVQTFIAANTTELEDGRTVCMVQVGLTGRSNEDRSARVPGFTTSYVNVDTSGSLYECKAVAARHAMKAFLALPYERKLADFSFAREKGHAQPILAKVIAAAKRFEEKGAKAPGQAPTLSCKNQCRNGACVRTFADGRKENWTAPRVFDPITRDWKWDITSNACGV